MGYAHPHILVVVYHAEETSELIIILRGSEIKDLLYFALYWFHSFWCENVAQVFKFLSSKEGFVCIDFESCFLKAV